MCRKYNFRDQLKLHFVSFAVVNWIDLFTRPEYNKVLLSSLRFCQNEKGLAVYAWCMMPSHVHLIIGTKSNDMQNILRDYKSFTSGKLREEILKHPSKSRREWLIWMMERAGKKNTNNKGWQLWQQHNQPIELSTNEMLDQRLHYLHMNPVVSGYVNEPEHWRFSSAIGYSGGKGLLAIDFIE
jgi:REP element-mobilizing transposase RayT